MRHWGWGLFLGLLIFLKPNPLFGENEMTIVALGDSTTAGTPGFLSPAESPPEGSGNPESQYAYWIMKLHPEWKVLNRGVNGERSDQILRRFNQDVSAFKPDTVIVLAGVNDLYQGYSPESVKKNLILIYERALKEKIRVLACTVLPFDHARPEVLSRIQEVNRWIESYAQEKGLDFCDTYRAVEDPARLGKLFGSPDGLHPNVATYRKMGEAITEVLEKFLNLG